MSVAWEYVGYILVIGAIAMALLQIINEFSTLRAGFQSDWLKTWMEDRIKRFKEAKTRNQSQDLGIPDISLGDAMSQLIAHATGGDQHAFFSLVTNQFVGQINAAAQIAIDNPKENFSLIAVLAQASLTSVSFQKSITLTATSEKQDLGDLSTLLRYERPATSPPDAQAPATPSPTAPSPTAPPSEASYLEARNRVVHRIQRNLDSIQIVFSKSAARVDVLVSVGIGLCAGPVMFWVGGRGFLTGLLIGIPTGIAGGYIGPILNDIVLAIRRTAQP